MTDRPTEDEIVARALCQSRVYETGEGTCAVRCMETLGDARGGPHGCPHATEIHGKSASAALAALRSAGLVVEQGWHPIETAPKNKGTNIRGPKILVATTHHRQPVVTIMRYCAGYQNCWLDTDPHSCVWATEGVGDLWRPLPAPPATGGE